MICYNALMLGSTFSRPQLFSIEIYSQSNSSCNIITNVVSWATVTKKLAKICNCKETDIPYDVTSRSNDFRSVLKEIVLMLVEDLVEYLVGTRMSFPGNAGCTRVD